MSNRERLLSCIESIENESKYFHELAEELKEIDEALINDAYIIENSKSFCEKYLKMSKSLLCNLWIKDEIFNELCDIGGGLGLGEAYENS